MRLRRVLPLPCAKSLGQSRYLADFDTSGRMQMELLYSMHLLYGTQHGFVG